MAFVVRPDGSIVADTLDEALALAERLKPAAPVIGEPYSAERWKAVHAKDKRIAAALDKLIEIAEKEIDRTKHEPHYQRLAHMYHDRFQALRNTGYAITYSQAYLEQGRYAEAIASTTSRASRWCGKGSCTSIPCTAGSALSSATRARPRRFLARIRYGMG